jgi:hypothetical protein
MATSAISRAGIRAGQACGPALQAAGGDLLADLGWAARRAVQLAQVGVDAVRVGGELLAVQGYMTGASAGPPSGGGVLTRSPADG